MDASEVSRHLKLEVLYNGAPINGISFPLDIYRAPILFVHGLWGDETFFNTMFYDFITSSFCPERLMYRVNYEGDYHGAARSFSENSNVLYQNIDNLLLQARLNFYSSSKIDIVAHSMGGILSRLYINDKDPIHYRFDIHKFITIDYLTPELRLQIYYSSMGR